MKQLRNLVSLCLFVFIVGTSSTVYAEHVHHGDYTVSGIFDGDLVIIGGDLDVKNSFTINGDLKVIAGKVTVKSDNSSSTTVDLYVRGDLIVTNTKTLGDPGGLVDKSASVSVPTGKLEVTGELFTYSKTSSAGVVGIYGIRSGKIFTHGLKEANVEANAGSIHVVGDLTTKSDEDSAHVRAGAGQAAPPVSYDITAAYISTNGRGPNSGEVQADGSILVEGGIVTLSQNGPAFVKGALQSNGGIRAEYIFTKGYLDSSITSGVVAGSTGYIDVSGDIVTTSSTSHANVVATGGFVKAGNISTRVVGEPAGPASAFVSATEGVDAKGDIVTKTSAFASADAYVLSSNKNIKAKSIVTHARNDAYVRAQTGIDVREEIETKSFGASDGDIKATTGDIKAGSLQTDSQNGLAYAHSLTGSIDVKRTINTRSGTSSAKVEALGSVKAENIYTNAQTSGDAFASSAKSDVIIKDVISTKSTAGPAYVSALEGDVRARAIRTDGGTTSHIQAGSAGNPGSIIVVEDISTKSSGGDAFVKAVEGDIKAQKIKTEAPVASDDSIDAGSNTGIFQLVLHQPNMALKINNSEFDLDKDYDWDTMLSIDGTCTLNGKGHKIIFGTNGGISVLSGATLFLNNLEIDKVWGTAISCADNTALIKMQDVLWTLTDNYTFASGAFHFIGDVYINGPGNWFNYQSSIASTIQRKAMLRFGPQIILNYKSASTGGLGMVDETSRLNFDDATLRAEQDVRLTDGTLVLDNKVTFSVLASKTVFFGDGSPARNLIFEEHVAALPLKVGDGSIVNSNA